MLHIDPFTGIVLFTSTTTGNDFASLDPPPRALPCSLRNRGYLADCTTPMRILFDYDMREFIRRDATENRIQYIHYTTLRPRPGSIVGRPHTKKIKLFEWQRKKKCNFFKKQNRHTHTYKICNLGNPATPTRCLFAAAIRDVCTR